MSQPLLIDTCALIWIAALTPGESLGPLEGAMNEAHQNDEPLYLSPISGWEIGMLAGKGRLQIAMSPRAWLDRVMTVGRMQWADMPVDVLLASSNLPANPHGDPADRIIIATAREYGFRLVTRDRRILDYADKGHVQALAC